MLSHRVHLLTSDVRERPWSLPGPRRDGNGGIRRLLYAVHQMLSFCSVFGDSARSSRPQPMASRRDAAPCEVSREERGLSFNFLAPRSVAGCFLRSWCALSPKGPGGSELQVEVCGVSLQDRRRVPAQKPGYPLVRLVGAPTRRSRRKHPIERLADSAHKDN